MRRKDLEPTIESIGPRQCVDDDRLDRREPTCGGNSARDLLEVHGDILVGGQ